MDVLEKKKTKMQKTAQKTKKAKPRVKNQKTSDRKMTDKINSVQKEGEHSRNRDEERARKREARRRKVRRQKIAIVVVVVLLLVGIGSSIVFCLPALRVSRKLSAGDKYTRNSDYQMAQTSYEEALQIDPTTVKAYRCLAQNDLEQNDSTAAKEILYTGWETTQDEGLLNYYCTVILNEAVAELNDKICNMGTVDKCVQVLEKNPANADAISLLDTCYKRLFRKEDENPVCTLFMDEDVSTESCQYDAYEQNVRRMYAVYVSQPSDELLACLTHYMLLDAEQIYFTSAHAESYLTLLKEINQTINNTQVTDLIACLDKAMEMKQYFAGMFGEFEDGNFESAKDFILTNEYQELRDSFINGNSGYWAGSDFIPVNQDNLVLHYGENGYQFSFLDYNDYENTQGVITVWGNVQMDDGVQRTSISYEPASENGEYYPHKEYVIIYCYTNVGNAAQHMPQMNFHFETRTTTEEGMTTDAIFDWGGEHEWEKSY